MPRGALLIKGVDDTMVGWRRNLIMTMNMNIGGEGRVGGKFSLGE